MVGLLTPPLPPDEYATDSPRRLLLDAMRREGRTIKEMAAFFRIEERTAGYLLALRGRLLCEELCLYD